VPGDAPDPLAVPRPTDPGSVLHDLPPAVGASVNGGGARSAGREAAGARGEGRALRFVVEWGLVLLIAIGVAFGMRQFVVGTYYIPSQSMEPTLMVGDRILVSKLSYHFHDVHRGDIVVFGRPPGETASEIKDLVKRVIGLPGETISSGPNGQVLIDGKPIDQPWLTSSARADPGPPIRTQTIPANEYFVMGDNRGDSEDSRFFGTIPHSIIVGHVVLRFWPLGSLHIF
jgi:signal peptidase I